MIHFTNATGLAGSVVAITAAAVMLPGIPRISKLYRIGLACTVAIAALAPFGGLPLAAYVRSMTGDLSIASLILLLSAILNRLSGWQPFDARARLILLFLVALAALGLYPMALGVGYFDPYRLGYGNLWFLSVLLLVALAACLRRLPVVALCIAFAVFAWNIGWHESNNLWDYLIDPLLSIYAISTVMNHSVQTLLKLRRSCLLLRADD